METFLKVIENTTWYRQFIYGAILALFFGVTTIAAGFNPFWTVVQIAVIAWAREDYLRDLSGTFNWRNFYFLQVPSLLLYYIYTAF